MTSKACFSNRTGFFRQLTAKQLWLFALWSVFLLFLYPLSGMMEYSSITARADLMNLQFSVDRSFLSRTYVVLFMMPVLAIVFSSCFGYLNSRQKLDFYHSQPVTRVRLFFTNYLSGLFHFLIPYLVMHTLAFVLMNSITGFYKTDPAAAGLAAAVYAGGIPYFLFACHTVPRGLRKYGHRRAVLCVYHQPAGDRVFSVPNLYRPLVEAVYGQRHLGKLPVAVAVYPADVTRGNDAI